MDKAQTLNDVLTEEAKRVRREYNAKWQREHPDKVREYHRRYWEKQAAKRRAKNEEV